MPITLRPEMVAMRAATADMERATSSARLMTRLDFTPAAGSNSYSVTTGPGRTAVMRPLTPKSDSTASNMRAFSSSASSDRVWVSFTVTGSASRSSAGSWYSPLARFSADWRSARLPPAGARASRLTRFFWRSARRVAAMGSGLMLPGPPPGPSSSSSSDR